MKSLGFLFWVIAGLALAVVPEFLMYRVWKIIHPTTPLEKILMLGGFWGLGGGLCLLFLIVGLVLSVEAFSNLVKSTNKKRRIKNARS